MKMTFRWYGSQMDPIPLRYIKQIPNMSGVVNIDISLGSIAAVLILRAIICR